LKINEIMFMTTDNQNKHCVNCLRNDKQINSAYVQSAYYFEA